MVIYILNTFFARRSIFIITKQAIHNITLLLLLNRDHNDMYDKMFSNDVERVNLFVRWHIIIIYILYLYSSYNLFYCIVFV